MNRREFLACCGAAGAASAAGMLGWPRGTWAWAAGDGEGPAVVVVFLRGAVDGLSVVVPYAERRYYDLRPTVAVAQPGKPGGAIDLDGRFGLHPALEPLARWYRDGRLAFVHATGSPDPTRSHFDAQDYMETGVPGDKSVREGWLNRGLAALGGSQGTFDGVALSPVQPVITGGSQAMLCVPELRALRLDAGKQASRSFEEMYAGAVRTVLGEAGREAFTALSEVQRGRLAAVKPAENYPKGRLGTSLPDISRLLKAGVGTRLAFTDAGGWDTHGRQSATLETRLRELGTALSAFAADLGPHFDRTLVLVMSEFGRTVAENGTGGTDHGHGNAMWVLGGKVRGGRVLGDWPGLDESALYEGRDLAITTDFRTVAAEAWGGHMGSGHDKLFPGFKSGK
ncbi:MAG: DUF1501 domain-containing protein, partial [Candidatus Sericytochromatia bacterium]|nr:DUF1501 domain-containing protein [Candidatus Tanganyikabacteria bacterium]